MSDMLIEPPTEEDWQRLVQHYNTTRERIAQDVALLKQWFAQQPHLPQTGHGDLLFQTFLIRRKMSVEQAKIALDSYFTVKTVLSDYYSGRDPMLPGLQDLLNIGQISVAPRPTDEGDRIIVARIIDPDAAKLVPYYCAKIVLMFTELFHTKYEVLDINTVLVMDCTHIHIGHVAQLSFAEVKQFEVCLSKGHHCRVKAVHMVNPPPVFSIIMTMLKGILNSKMLGRVHLHPSLESLHEHIPSEYLPEEYGGKQRSIVQTAVSWRKKVESLRDWFLEQEVEEKVDESKREEKVLHVDDIFGIQGTFRQLTVD